MSIKVYKKSRVFLDFSGSDGQLYLAMEEVEVLASCSVPETGLKECNVACQMGSSIRRWRFHDEHIWGDG